MCLCVCVCLAHLLLGEKLQHREDEVAIEVATNDRSQIIMLVASFGHGASLRDTLSESEQ